MADASAPAPRPRFVCVITPNGADGAQVGLEANAPGVTFYEVVVAVAAALKALVLQPGTTPVPTRAEADALKARAVPDGGVIDRG